jgi:dihydrofolate reductase
MINLIVAISNRNVIGNNGEIPWQLPGDLKRFKQITMGHPIIMGRKTFESIGRPLPGRDNIILTRNREYNPKGTQTFFNLEDALWSVKDDEVFIIGGEEIYRLSIWHANRIYMTRVYEEFEGDTFFPPYPHRIWTLTYHEFNQEPLPHSYQVYDRLSRNQMGAVAEFF